MTPPWAVYRILEAVSDVLPFNKPDGLPTYWLEPCAGNGQLIKAVNGWLSADWSDDQANVRWHACEIRPECEEVLKTLANPVVIGDFLKVVPAKYDVVLTNPPFEVAEEFVRACLPIATHTVMLLRLNWVENRDELLRDHPADIWVLPNRPVFGRNKHGKVAADAASYAWLHWWPGATGRLRHLGRTPKTIRSAYRKWLDETLPRRATDAVQGADRKSRRPRGLVRPDGGPLRASVPPEQGAAEGGSQSSPGQLDECAAEGVRGSDAGAPQGAGGGEGRRALGDDGGAPSIQEFSAAAAAGACPDEECGGRCRATD